MSGRLLLSESFLLDTHVWFRLQTTSGPFRPGVLETLTRAAELDALFVSPISVWELAMLARDGYIEFPGGVGRWVDDALLTPGLRLLPYAPAAAIESVFLPEPMHKDPSDRILVASAKVEGMTLVTSDRAMLKFARSSGLRCLRA